MTNTNLSANGDTGNQIEGRLAGLRERIDRASRAAGRDAQNIRLLAVSKGQDVTALQAAHALGQRHFGENYLSEALDKIAALPGDCVWHFIGPIQSNKTAAIAANFSWVHSLDRIKIAHRLAAQRPDGLPPLKVCIQVRIGGETDKAGIDADALPELAQTVQSLPQLTLAGLMCIPRPSPDPARQAAQFSQLAALRDTLSPPPPDLSMGMSADLEAAVACGSTWLRIGRALFGPRQPRKTSA